MMGAEKAERTGLVSSIVPAGKLLDERRTSHAALALEDPKEGMATFAEKHKPVAKYR